MIATATHRVVAGLDDRGRGVLYEEPLAELGAGQVRVRVTATMISPGTQLQGVSALRRGVVSGSAQPQAKRRPLGYQAAGVVEAVGAGVQDVEPGQRVACFGPGALHASYVVVPQRLCAVIPEGVSDAEASGMNLVLTAIQALRRTPAQFGESLLVVGLGVVGQLVLQVAAASGLEVMGWDLDEGRVARARSLGVGAAINPRGADWFDACRHFTHGQGFDAAVLAVGGDGTAALEQVKSVMKVSPDGHAMGHITLVGGLTTTMRWGAGMGNLDLHSSARSGPGYHDPAWERGEVAYPEVFVRWTTQSHLTLALRMMAQGRIRVAPLITDVLPLEQIDQAIASLTEQPDRTLAVVLQPDQG